MDRSQIQEKDREEIGNKIRDRRMELGLTQEDLADMMGAEPNKISRHENGKVDMKISTFIEYTEALELKPEALLPSRLNKKSNAKEVLIQERINGLPDDDLDLILAVVEKCQRANST